MAGSRVARSSLKVTTAAPPCLGWVSAKAGDRTRAPASAAAATAACVRLRMSSFLPGFLVERISSQADARVNQGRHEIGEQVADDDGDGGNQRDAHDDGDIDPLNGLPGELADAGPAIDRFDDDGAAHEGADVETNDRHHRQ